MSSYKFNVTVEIDDKDNNYNACTFYCGIKNAVQKYLRFCNLNHSSNVEIERGDI